LKAGLIEETINDTFEMMEVCLNLHLLLILSLLVRSPRNSLEKLRKKSTA
jgi:hypothetical protein